MAFENSFRFLLDGIVITPFIGNEFMFDYDKFEGSYSFRKKLKTPIKFNGKDYDTIEQASVRYKFTLLIQEYNGSDWQDYFSGYFYKTDCSFDQDIKIVEADIISDDGYEDIKSVLNNEYDLIKLGLTPRRINFDIKPVFQVVFITGVGLELKGQAKIYNFYGTMMWEEQLEEEVDLYDLRDIYLFNWYIDLNPSTPTVYIFTRWLTKETTWNHYGGGSDSTVARPTPDISGEFTDYDRVYTTQNGLKYEIFGGYQDDPTPYGQIINADDCSEKLGKYYLKPDSNEFTRATDKENWDCYSYWLKISQYYINTIKLNTISYSINDGYLITDVIATLLAQETDIVHEDSVSCSEFLYSSVNPVSGEDKFYPFITPKSNVKNIFYTNPSTRTTIKLSDVLELLKFLYNVYWHIEEVDGEKIFRLEHISWYNNGGIYGSQSVEIDLTTTYDIRLQKPFSYYQNKYTYNKANMTQRYEFSWMDVVSGIFTGYPIRIVDGQVEQGNIVKYQVNQFTSDIDAIIASEGISLDGFAYLAAIIDNGEYIIEKIQIKYNGVFVDSINGKASYIYLHDNYFGYNMPAETININNVEQAAISIMRNKQQEVEFAILGQAINPLKLITTGLGSGQVDKMTLNLINFKYKITLNHDIE